MEDDSIVFPLGRDYKMLEKEIGEIPALKAEVELLRSILMEDGRRDLISKAEKAMFKRMKS